MDDYFNYITLLLNNKEGLWLKGNARVITSHIMASLQRCRLLLTITPYNRPFPRTPRNREIQRMHADE